MGYVPTKGFFVKTVGHTFKTDQTRLLHLADVKKGVQSPQQQIDRNGSVFNRGWSVQLPENDEKQRECEKKEKKCEQPAADTVQEWSGAG